jgi:hypothetical protein
MKYLKFLLLPVFILSCATPPQISDDGFISSQPNFQVQFKKPIVGKYEKYQRVMQGEVNTYWFFVNKWEGILIEIVTYIPSRSGFEFYGPEQVLTNWGRMDLGPVTIDGRQWIKFADTKNNKFLFAGYFIMMDYHWISVGRISNSDAYTKRLQSVKSGAPLSNEEMKILAEVFEYTDQLFSIGRK